MTQPKKDSVEDIVERFAQTFPDYLNIHTSGAEKWLRTKLSTLLENIAVEAETAMFPTKLKIPDDVQPEVAFFDAGLKAAAQSIRSHI